MSDVNTLCHVCGAPSKHVCALCGRHTCPKHFNSGLGICSSCLKGKRETELKNAEWNSWQNISFLLPPIARSLYIIHYSVIIISWIIIGISVKWPPSYHIAQLLRRYSNPFQVNGIYCHRTHIRVISLHISYTCGTLIRMPCIPSYICGQSWSKAGMRSSSRCCIRFTIKSD